MSTPWKRAHERLLAKLPVRTHTQRGELLAPEGDRRGRQPIPAGHKAGRAVLYRGTTYKSVSSAARTLKVHPRTIYDWVRIGRAQFVK